MTTDRITATAINIAQNLLDENIDHPDAWIPVKRSDLDIMSAAFERYRQLEANIANMLTLLNGSVATPAAVPTAIKGPVAYHPLPAATAEEIADNIGSWLQLAHDYEDLDAQHANYVEHLTDGNLSWRKLEEKTRHNLICWIIYRIQVALDDETITAALYDLMAPSWAPRASALYKTKPFTEWVSDAMEKYASLAEPFRG